MEEKKLAITLFNQTWDLLDQKLRTKKDDALMIHKAHASLYHWLQVGGPLEAQRGEWMVSHVYAVLKMGESAVFHAEQCLDYTKTNDIKDFDLSFAYEALARAYALTNKEKAKEYLTLAKESLHQISNTKDKAYVESQLEDIKL